MSKKPMPWEDESIAPNGRPVKDNFAEWFGQSRVESAKGQPLVVFRGDRRVPRSDYFVTRQGRETVSFSTDPEIAGVYARQLDSKIHALGSNITAVYLAIQNPIDLRDLDESVSLDQIIGILKWDWSVKHALDRKKNAVIGYGDLADSVRGMDELAYNTNARFKIEASDNNGWRIDSFEELADFIQDRGAVGDFDSIDCVLMNVSFDAYMLGDSRDWVRVFEKLGFDGIFHKDVFDVGVEFYEGDKSRLEVGYDGGPVHSTYRPFRQEQIKSAIGNNGNYDSQNPSLTDHPADAEVEQQPLRERCR